MSAQAQLRSLAERIYGLKKTVPYDAQSCFDFQDYVSQAGLLMARSFLDGELLLDDIPWSHGVGEPAVKRGELILHRVRNAVASISDGDRDHPAYPGVSERSYVGAAFFDLLLYRWLLHKYPEKIRWNPGQRLSGTMRIYPVPNAEARQKVFAEMEARRQLLATEPIPCPCVFQLGSTITYRQGDCISLAQSQVNTYADACRVLADLTPDAAWAGGERAGGLPTGKSLIKEVRGGIVDHGASESEAVFARDGQGWLIKAFGQQGHLRGLVGCNYLKTLISNMGIPVPTLELVGAQSQAVVGSDARSQQPTLDAQAKNELKAIFVELNGKLEKAKKNNDQAQIEKIQDQLENLTRNTTASLGLGGKSRDLNNPLAKLRSRVHAALNEVYAALRAADPPMNKIADHFHRNISSRGGAFTYGPQPPPPWRFELSGPPSP